MFSALRQNSIIYILDKTNDPVLKKGLVISVTAPKAKNNAIYGYHLNMVVDIEVNVGGTKELFQDIPASLSTATDGNLVITESREYMSSEIESLLANSKQIIDSMPYHNKAIQLYDTMLLELNPLIAREREHESKINVLEDKVTGIETSLSDIKTMLSKVLNK